MQDKLIDFNHLSLNRDFILSRISEEDIFRHYLNVPFQLGRPMKSPLRTRDDDPSFNIYRTPMSGELRYKDFGYSGGNCFEFVRNLFGVDYKTALRIIAKDFNLTAEVVHVPKKEPEAVRATAMEAFKKQILPTKRSFKKLDFDYWNQYGIPLTDLQRYDISACKYVYLHNREDSLFLWGEHRDDDPIYCYEVSYNHKIYRPLSREKKRKWLATTTIWDIQGMKQLPAKGELLIITSSMKDLLVLRQLGYTAIAPGGEAHGIPEKIMDYLWACFDNIVVFYDNDPPGKLSAERFQADNAGTAAIFIPDDYAEKDISDFRHIHGAEETQYLMKRLL